MGLLIKTTLEVALTVFLFPMSTAEIKKRAWQLFLLPVVQLETTRSGGTWFPFNLSPANRNHLFKQLWYLFENKRSAPVLARQSNTFSWLRDKFRNVCSTMARLSVFSFIFATCEETTRGLLEKSENANQKKWKIKNRLLWKVSILHLGKMEIR